MTTKRPTNTGVMVFIPSLSPTDLLPEQAQPLSERVEAIRNQGAKARAEAKELEGSRSKMIAGHHEAVAAALLAGKKQPNNPIKDLDEKVAQLEEASTALNYSVDEPLAELGHVLMDLQGQMLTTHRGNVTDLIEIALGQVAELETTTRNLGTEVAMVRWSRDLNPNIIKGFAGPTTNPTSPMVSNWCAGVSAS